MIKVFIFTSAGIETKIFQSLDHAQDYINQGTGVICFRAFQINGKRQKEKKDGNR